MGAWPYSDADDAELLELSTNEQNEYGDHEDGECGRIACGVMRLMKFAFLV